MEEQSKVQPDINPPVEKSKNSNALLVLLLIVLFLIASGIAIYTVYQNNQLKKQVTELRTNFTPKQIPLSPTIKPTDTILPESTEMPTATSTSNPTEGWKTFTDNKITFKYPGAWQLVATEGGEIIEEPTSDAILKTIGSYVNSTAKDDLHNYLKNSTSYGNQGLKYLEEKSITINGASGWYTHIEISVLDKEDIIVFLEDKNFPDRYTGLWLTNISNRQKAIFDKILSTFKFIE